MVQKGKFDFDGEEWDEISKEAKDLIKKLICRPEKRLTAQEALNHKWFKKQFWVKKTFWSDGYFVCSVGNAAADTIQKYIQEQG